MREQRTSRPPYHRRTQRTKASQPTLAKKLEKDFLNIFKKSEATVENEEEAGEDEADSLAVPFTGDIPAFIKPDAEEMN